MSKAKPSHSAAAKRANAAKLREQADRHEAAAERLSREIEELEVEIQQLAPRNSLLQRKEAEDLRTLAENLEIAARAGDPSHAAANAARANQLRLEAKQLDYEAAHPRVPSREEQRRYEAAQQLRDAKRYERSTEVTEAQRLNAAAANADPEPETHSTSRSTVEFGEPEVISAMDAGPVGNSQFVMAGDTGTDILGLDDHAAQPGTGANSGNLNSLIQRDGQSDADYWEGIAQEVDKQIENSPSFLEAATGFGAGATPVGVVQAPPTSRATDFAKASAGSDEDPWGAADSPGNSVNDAPSTTDLHLTGDQPSPGVPSSLYDDTSSSSYQPRDTETMTEESDAAAWEYDPNNP
jgi:hypothetical protein